MFRADIAATYCDEFVYLKVKGLDICYSAAYTRVRLRSAALTISEVAAIGSS